MKVRNVLCMILVVAVIFACFPALAEASLPAAA